MGEPKGRPESVQGEQGGLKLRPGGALGASKVAPKMSLKNFSIRSQIFEAAKWQPESVGWPECSFYDVKVTIFKEIVKIVGKNGGELIF